MIPVSAADGYALWAETWDSTPSPIVAVERRGLLPWVTGLRAGRTIDIGCGTGRWTGELGAVGFDFSPEMLARAVQKPGLRGRVAQADAADLPIASGCCDLLLCALTLAHLVHPEQAWREFARIVRPGGMVVLSDFHPEAVAHGWRRTFRRDGVVYEVEHHPYSLEQLQAPELRLIDCADLTIGEPERHLFTEAGRPELFDEARQVPVVLMSRWTRV